MYDFAPVSATISKNLKKERKILQKIRKKREKSEFGAVQKCVNLVERQKSFQMRLLSLS